MEKMGIAVVGFGNIGQSVVKPIQDAADMELKGAVEISDRLGYGPQILPDVLFSEDIAHIPDSKQKSQSL